MLSVETPKDLLRNVYIFLQAHTTRKPGPRFLTLLKKAGIEQIEPPTQEEIKNYMNETNQPKAEKPSFLRTVGEEIATEIFANEEVIPLLTAMAGGGLLNNIREAVRTSRQLQVSLAIAITGVTIDIYRYATSEGDEQTTQFITDSSWLSMIVSWIGYDLYTTIEEQRTQRERDQRAAEIRRERAPALLANLGLPQRRRIQVNLGNMENALEAATQASQILNVQKIPSSGTLRMILTDDNIDPITQQPFRVGDLVAVVNDERRAPVLRSSLQSWIAACSAQGREPTHPTTRTPITSENVRVLIVLRETTGGKRKTRKQLKKFSKKQQNVRPLRKSTRRQIYKKR